MVNPVEVEVKLRLTEAAAAALERHPALNPPRAHGPRRRTETTIYFDTTTGTLAAQGMSLRVRRTGDGRFVQTLKLGDVGGGAAARRVEREWTIDSEMPVLGLIAHTESVHWLDSPLAPFCATEIDRAVWRIDADDGATIEAVVDRGKIVAGAHHVDVTELELELKTGVPGSLYRLALELADAVPLATEPASKAERGARLMGWPPRAAARYTAIVLPKKLPANESFTMLLGGAIGHLRLNIGPASRGQPEGIHQLRVAARRCRAVLALFRPLLIRENVECFNARLRDAGRVFGEARDWDVFVTETLPAAESDGLAPAWRALIEHAAETPRLAAHVAVARELATPAFTRLLLELSAWAEQGRADSASIGMAELNPSFAPQRAPKLLDRLRRRAAHRAQRAIDGDGAAEMHGLRKAIKTMRYAMDFAAPLYKKKRVERVLKECKHLQSLLGEVNDAASAARLAGYLATEDRAELTQALHALTEWAERRSRKAAQRVPRAWREFVAKKPFWK